MGLPPHGLRILALDLTVVLGALGLHGFDLAITSLQEGDDFEIRLS